MTEPIVTRGGRMRRQDLRRALDKSARSGVYELSVQVTPFADADTHSDIVDTWLIHKSACWSTPQILAALGLELVPSPDVASGPHHHDVRHPAKPGEESVDIVIEDYQRAFFGPAPIESIHSESTEDDLRRLQQPNQPDDQ